MFYGTLIGFLLFPTSYVGYDFLHFLTIDTMSNSDLLLSDLIISILKDNDGQTPLHYAVTCEREAIAEYLVKHSADINSKDNEGSSSRDICSSKWPFMQHEEEAK